MKKKDIALIASAILLPGGSILAAYWIYKKLKKKQETPEGAPEN